MAAPDVDGAPTRVAQVRRGSDPCICAAQRSAGRYNRAPMGSVDETELVPIRSYDDLLAPLHRAIRPRSEALIGAEAEKFGLLERSLRPLHYGGDHGVVRVMRELCASHGWRVAQDDPLLALEKDGASVTLEPGAQFELSGAPLPDLHAIDAEFTQHHAELGAVSELFRRELGEGIAWLGLGFHPLAAQADLDWVPKSRYGVMRRYLPTRGAHGLEMMRRTATVQANFDYASEAEAMRALRVGLRLSPFFIASLANSPFVEGQLYGGKSYRADVWTDVDPSRQGLVPRVLDSKGGFADYVEWVLDAPMFLLLRDGKVVENTGQSFRDFMANGFEGHVATEADWVTHLNSMFPEVRLKRTLEVRGADSLPRDLLVAPAAIFTGIFYDERALSEAEALVAPYSTEQLLRLRAEVGKSALASQIGGAPILETVNRMVAIARGGLERRARKRADGRDEAVYLEPLEARLAKGRCPADDLIDALRRTGSVAEALFETVRL